MIGLERFITGTIYNLSAVRLIIFLKIPELGKSSSIILIHQVQLIDLYHVLFKLIIFMQTFHATAGSGAT